MEVQILSSALYMEVKNLEKRLRAIEVRNNKVEADKAWETSLTRKILLALFTYLAIGLYLQFILGLNNAWLNAVIPSIGFLLSTLSLPFFKRIWIEKIYKK